MGGGAPFVWFHNGRPLIHGGKSSAGLGTVSIYLEGVNGESIVAAGQQQQLTGGSDWTSWTSRLVIQRADPADSGNYTCTPWRGKAASVSVFVSQGMCFTECSSISWQERPYLGIQVCQQRDNNRHTTQMK